MIGLDVCLGLSPVAPPPALRVIRFGAPEDYAPEDYAPEDYAPEDYAPEVTLGDVVLPARAVEKLNFGSVREHISRTMRDTGEMFTCDDFAADCISAAAASHALRSLFLHGLVRRVRLTREKTGSRVRLQWHYWWPEVDQ